MDTFRFVKFPVYVKSKELFAKVSNKVENVRDYSLKDQTKRAALSIILNIAEGSAKKSDKDFARFIQISLGSVNELVACLEVLRDSGLINKSDFLNLFSECESIAKQLGGFSKKLQES